VNQPASFAVQLNGARGVIDARVHTPSGAVEECYVSELDSGELAPPLPSPAGLGSLAKG
jgi:filamin